MALCLVVDNDRDYRETIAAALEYEGHQVDQACGVAQAQDMLQRIRYELVLTDLQMDDGSGFDVLDTIQVMSDPRPKAILMTNACDQVGIPKQAIHHGAKLFLEKPSRLEQLTKAVETVIGKTVPPPHSKVA